MNGDQILRTILILIIMGTCFGWWLSIHHHKAVWLASGDKRSLIVSWGVFVLMLVNGAGVVYAATAGYPITGITVAYAAAYALLNLLMYVPLRKDPSVPQRRAIDSH